MVFLSSVLFSRTRNTLVPYNNIFLAPKNPYTQDFSYFNYAFLAETRKPPVGDPSILLLDIITKMKSLMK